MAKSFAPEGRPRIASHLRFASSYGRAQARKVPWRGSYQSLAQPDNALKVDDLFAEPITAEEDRTWGVTVVFPSCSRCSALPFLSPYPRTRADSRTRRPP